MEIKYKKKFVLCKKTLILELNKSIYDFFSEYIMYLSKLHYHLKKYPSKIIKENNDTLPTLVGALTFEAQPIAFIVG